MENDSCRDVRFHRDELLQPVFGRRFDINDIILNGIGVIASTGIYYLFKRIIATGSLSFANNGCAKFRQPLFLCAVKRLPYSFAAADFLSSGAIRESFIKWLSFL